MGVITEGAGWLFGVSELLTAKSFRTSDWRKASPVSWPLLTLVTLGFLPMLTVIPAPLADWASHLSRVIVIEKVFAGDPFWTARYHFSTLFLPNAALDAIILGLTRLDFPLDLAGIVFLLFCYLSFVIGFYNFARANDMPSRLALAVGISFFYTANIMYSLVNYMLGIGLAMAAVSYMLSSKSVLSRCIVAVVASPIIAFCHLIASGLLVALYAIQALFSPISDDILPGRGLIERRLMLQVPSILAFAVFIPVYLSLPPDPDHARELLWLGQPSVTGILYGKIKEIAEGISLGSFLADGFLVATIGLAIWGLWRNRRGVQRHQLFTVAAISMMPLTAPFAIGGGSLFDARLMIVALSSAFAILPWWQGLTVEYRLSVYHIQVIRTVLIGFLWLSYNPIYSQLNAEFSKLPKGSTLLSAYSDTPSFYEDRAPPLHEMAALAVRYGVFVPSMWAQPSQHPLNINLEWRPKWLWSHSANARTPEDMASVMQRAKRYCAISPRTYLFILHVTEEPPFSIVNICGGGA